MSDPHARRLTGRHVVLGVSGSVAAFKAAEIARLLMGEGATVRAVLTDGAQKFITPLTFESLTGQPVYTDMFAQPQTWEMEHITWARWADALLVAPATANVVAKIAHGISDDPLSALCLAREARVPLLVAPAMNSQMWLAAPTRRNVARLRDDGVTVIEPGSGELACGESGPGRLAEIEAIMNAVANTLTSAGDLAGKRVLINAGPTREALDAARVITNPSTGKMGFALAAAAARRGARVTLVAGPASLPTPAGVERIDVVTAEQMWQTVEPRWRDHDAVIFAAAVSDFRPVDPSDSKIAKGEAALTVTLEPTVDIAAEIGRQAQGRPVLVGFAAETGDIEARARAKAEAKGLDLVVANEIGRDDSGFGADTTRAVLVPRAGEAEALGLVNKADLAERILDRVREALA